jgi:hypothetical protein
MMAREKKPLLPHEPGYTAASDTVTSRMRKELLYTHGHYRDEVHFADD